MAVRPIVKFGDPVLQRATKPVNGVDDDVRSLVDDMIETMYKAPGVGLAANQIGVPLRIAVIDCSVGEQESDLHVLLNPSIIETSGRAKEEEGCLSFPDIVEFITRPGRAVLRYRDLDWNEQTLEECVRVVLDHLRKRGWLAASG